MYPDGNGAHGSLVPATFLDFKSANLVPMPLGTSSLSPSFATGDLQSFPSGKTDHTRHHPAIARIARIVWPGRLGLRVRAGMARMDRFEKLEIQIEICLEFLVA